MRSKGNVDVPGFHVTVYGAVINIKTGRIMKHSLDEDGYPIVYLWCAVKKKTYKRRVHRLVGLAHVEGRTEEKDEIDHRDRDRMHCHATNLRWVTRSFNLNRRRFQK